MRIEKSSFLTLVKSGIYALSKFNELTKDLEETEGDIIKCLDHRSPGISPKKKGLPFIDKPLFIRLKKKNDMTNIVN